MMLDLAIHARVSINARVGSMHDAQIIIQDTTPFPAVPATTKHGVIPVTDGKQPQE